MAARELLSINTRCYGSITSADGRCLESPPGAAVFAAVLRRPLAPPETRLLLLRQLGGQPSTHEVCLFSWALPGASLRAVAVSPDGADVLCATDSGGPCFCVPVDSLFERHRALVRAQDEAKVAAAATAGVSTNSSVRAAAEGGGGGGLPGAAPSERLAAWLAREGRAFAEGALGENDLRDFAVPHSHAPATQPKRSGGSALPVAAAWWTVPTGGGGPGAAVAVVAAVGRGQLVSY